MKIGSEPALARLAVGHGLAAPGGDAHRIEGFTADIETWFVFQGHEGGER
jgi:hypothetical protein